MKIGGYLIYDKEKIFAQRRVMSREMYESARDRWTLIQYEMDCMNKEFAEFCEKEKLFVSAMALLLDRVDEGKTERIHTRIHTHWTNCKWIGEDV